MAASWLDDDPWHHRRHLPGVGLDEVWLVGRGLASAAELAAAESPREAAGYLRWALPHAEALLEAVADGRAVLLVGPSTLGPVDPSAPETVTDLVDLIEPEPPAPAPAPEPEPEPIEDPDHFVEVLVLDALGQPAAGIDYALTIPDGTTRTGRTDSAGMLRIDGLHDAGACSLTFPDLQTPATNAPPQQGAA